MIVKFITRRWKFKLGFQQGGLNYVLLQTTSNNDWIMQVVLMLRSVLTPNLKFVPS